MGKPRKTRSIIWKYFTKLSSDQVTCNICHNVFSYSSNSNLYKHLKHKHVDTFYEMETTKEDKPNEVTDTKNEGGIWKYFNRIGSDVVKCEFCSNVFVFKSTSIPNLKRHLQKHLCRKSQPSVNTDIGDGSFGNKRQRSLVWKYFNKEGPAHARCKFCSNIYSFKSGSTSNLSKHIAVKHPLHEDESKIEKIIITCDTEELQLAADFSEHTVKTKRTHLEETSPVISELNAKDNTKSLSKLLLNFIVKQYHTFEIVDQKEFKEFIKMLNPEYILPTTAEISNSIFDEVYNSKASEIRMSLNSSTTCSITVDQWLSASNVSFISVTVNYINNDGLLCTSLLDCFMCVENCTAEVIVEGINDICQAWEIDTKIIAIMSAKSDTIKSAANMLGWTHILCFSDALVSIINRSLLEITDLKEKVDVIFTFFKTDVFALMQLQTAEEGIKFYEEILSLDVSKKWNTTILTFQTLLRNKTLIVATLTLLKPELLLSEEELEILEKVNELFTPFLEAISDMNSKNQVNISKVILLTYRLTKFVDKYNENDCTSKDIEAFLKILKTEIRQLLEEVENDTILCEATFLDPRFKEHGFHNKEIYNSTKNTIRKKIQNTIFVPATINDDAILQVRGETSSLWDEFDIGIENLSESCSIVAGTLELDRYIEEMLLSRREDPLQWWKIKEVYYPNLYNLMKKTLCVAGSTLFCDSHIFSEKLNTSPKLSKLLFLHYNF